MWWVVLLGCAPDESAADSADPCADAPVLSWADAGEPLLLEHCSTCHASTATDRYGAPEGVVFDRYDDVIAHRARLLAVLESQPARMPPVMPIPEDDRLLLVSWLRCDVPTEP
jgi:uncharacterized membrane protein